MLLKLELDETSFLVTTLACAVCLVVVHVFFSALLHFNHDVHWLMVQLFDLDDENNLPTWFSSFLLLFVSFALMTLVTPPKDRLYWQLLAAGFLVMSIDEVAGLHESLNTAIEMNWAIPGTVLVAAVGVWFAPFLMRQPARLRWLMMLSGLIYVGGVIGVELLSADIDSDSLQYEAAVSVEESMEMFGVWLFLRTLLTSPELNRL